MNVYESLPNLGTFALSLGANNFIYFPGAVQDCKFTAAIEYGAIRPRGYTQVSAIREPQYSILPAGAPLNQNQREIKNIKEVVKAGVYSKGWAFDGRKLSFDLIVWTNDQIVKYMDWCNKLQLPYYKASNSGHVINNTYRIDHALANMHNISEVFIKEYEITPRANNGGFLIKFGLFEKIDGSLIEPSQDIVGNVSVADFGKRSNKTGKPKTPPTPASINDPDNPNLQDNVSSPWGDRNSTPAR